LHPMHRDMLRVANLILMAAFWQVLQLARNCQFIT